MEEWTIPDEPYESMIGPGKRYATEKDMATDLWRWHDEAQAEKMFSMQLVGRLDELVRLARHLYREVGALQEILLSCGIPPIAPASEAAPADADLHDPEHGAAPPQNPPA